MSITNYYVQESGVEIIINRMRDLLGCYNHGFINNEEFEEAIWKCVLFFISAKEHHDFAKTAPTLSKE